MGPYSVGYSGQLIMQPIYKLLTKALHFVDEEKLESGYAKTRKDKIYLQRAACFFIESDYQAADIDATESLRLKLSTKVGIFTIRTGCMARDSNCTQFYKIVRYHKIPKTGQFHSWSDIRKPRKIY